MHISDWSSDVCSSDLGLKPISGTANGKLLSIMQISISAFCSENYRNLPSSVSAKPAAPAQQRDSKQDRQQHLEAFFKHIADFALYERNLNVIIDIQHRFQAVENLGQNEQYQRQQG